MKLTGVKFIVLGFLILVIACVCYWGVLKIEGPADKHGNKKKLSGGEKMGVNLLKILFYLGAFVAALFIIGGIKKISDAKKVKAAVAPSTTAAFAFY